MYLNGAKIKQVSNFDFLGVRISDNLTWTAHINELAIKIGKAIGILKRLKRFLPTSILLMIYNAIILSRLNFSILAWGFDISRLEILQKKAIRAVFNTKYNAHTEPFFKTHRLLKLEDIFNLRCLKFYYNLKNNKVPLYFHEMLPTAGSIHGRATRQAAGLHQQRAPRTAGASKCLKNKILDEIVYFDRSVLDKIHTHTFQSYSDYAKNFLINRYVVECRRDNCWICHRPATEQAPLPTN